jgi:hypothetical protein
LEEHDEGAECEYERCKAAPGTPKAEDSRLDRRLVSRANRGDEGSSLLRKSLPARRVVVAPARVVRSRRGHLGATTLPAATAVSRRSLSLSRQLIQTGEKTAHTSDIVITTNR